jgi:hypothetical protein
MRLILAIAALLVSACAAIPVRETMLRNAQGGTITCKQTGRGLVSYSVGKQLYEDCIAKAKAQGYQ